jgi:aquaporin Z
MERPNLARRALMEAIGTFALVTGGCGAIITNATHPGSIGGVGISLVFGLVIGVFAYELVRGSKPPVSAVRAAAQALEYQLLGSASMHGKLSA